MFGPVLTTNWTRATASLGNGNCVEARLAFGAVQLRDSKDPSGPTLNVNRADWAAFLSGVAKQQIIHSR
jgi:hypothetical protein